MSNQEGPQYVVFMIDKNPYCFWYYPGDLGATRIEELNLEFLDGIDPTYFQYLVNAHMRDETEEVSQHAAIALRAAYFQGLETLFALLGSVVQAPHCVVGWMTRYRNSELDSLVKKIYEGEPLPSLYDMTALSWEAIADLIHSQLIMDDKLLEDQIKAGYRKLWKRFSKDFLNKSNQKEYNNIKHGLRAKAGGFWLKMGTKEPLDDISIPEGEMMLVAQSRYGSSFFWEEGLEQNQKPKHHFRVKRQRKNWYPIDLAHGLNLLALSINNVIGFLKITNGRDHIEYLWPSPLDNFEKPWEKHLSFDGLSTQLKAVDFGVSNRNIHIPEDILQSLSKEELKEHYRKMPRVKV